MLALGLIKIVIFVERFTDEGHRPFGFPQHYAFISLTAVAYALQHTKDSSQTKFLLYSILYVPSWE
jgi:hypothetical protein